MERLYINDDDASFSVSGTSVTEGQSGSVRVTRPDPGVDEEASVWISAIDGTAMVSDGDYAFPRQLVTFEGRETSKSVSFATTGDSKIEKDESFTVKLDTPSAGYAITGETATVTIRNDDYSTFGVTGTSSVTEGGTATVNISRTGSTGNATFQIFAADGSTTADDYSFPRQEVEFTNGQTGATLVG